MIEDRLQALMTDLGERVPTRPAPLSDLSLAGERARARQTRVRVVAASVVVALIVGLGTVLGRATLGSSESNRRPNPAENGTAIIPPANTGTRLVGLATVAIEVPIDWGVNEIQCSSPTRNTVFVNRLSFQLCGSPYPANVDMASINHPEGPLDTSAWAETQVDGVAILTSPLRNPPNTREGLTPPYRSAVYVPSADVVIDIASSVSASRVEELLSSIHLLAGQAGIPPTSTIEGPIDPADYAQQLAELGLVPRITADMADFSDAHIFVSPPPGTVVPFGTPVVIAPYEKPQPTDPDKFLAIQHRDGTLTVLDADDIDQLAKQSTPADDLTLQEGDRLVAYGGPTISVEISSGTALVSEGDGVGFETSLGSASVTYRATSGAESATADRDLQWTIRLRIEPD